MRNAATASNYRHGPVRTAAEVARIIADKTGERMTESMVKHHEKRALLKIRRALERGMFK